MLYGGVEDESNLIFCFQNSYENDTDMDISKHNFNTFFSQRLLASITPYFRVKIPTWSFFHVCRRVSAKGQT